jgi:hypothetical protein
MRNVAVFLSLLALVVAIPAGAQSNSKNIARINTIKVKPGEGQQWEGASKRFHAWEHQHNVPGTMYALSVIAGGRPDDYLLGTFGRAWKDFGARPERNAKLGIGAEIHATVGPFEESAVPSYYAFLSELSSPVSPDQPPLPMSMVTFYTLKPGGRNPLSTPSNR